VRELVLAAALGYARVAEAGGDDGREARAPHGTESSLSPGCPPGALPSCEHEPL
jgi:hypothetical protein